MLETVLGDVASWHRLYLAAKPSHVGVDVDGLAFPLHRPTTYSRQTRGYSFLSGATLYHRATVGGGTFPGVRSPWAWIFDGVFTIWVPVLPNLTWSKPFLLGYAYPMSEPSWHLCMFPWLSYYVRR
jgi:hypothetical protein